MRPAAASKASLSGTCSASSMVASPYDRSSSSDVVRSGSASNWARRYVVPMSLASATTSARRAS